MEGICGFKCIVNVRSCNCSHCGWKQDGISISFVIHNFTSSRGMGTACVDSRRLLPAAVPPGRGEVPVRRCRDNVPHNWIEILRCSSMYLLTKTIIFNTNNIENLYVY